MARFRFYLRKPVRMSASKTLVDKTEKAGYGPIWLIDCRSVGTYGISVTPRGRSVFLPEIRRGDTIANGIPYGVYHYIIALVALIVIHHATLAEEVAVFAALAACFALIVALLRNRIASPAENCHPLHRSHRRCPPRRSRNRLRGYSCSPRR